MKQAIAVRTDLGMGTGKVAAQVAHASLQAYENADDDAGREWRTGGAKKIVLKASGETQLHELADAARRERLPHALVTDAGHTQVEPGTVTALAVGPGPENIVDKVTGDLSLY
jgi:PTH2 family peptidyl-tRNA hydrolase